MNLVVQHFEKYAVSLSIWEEFLCFLFTYWDDGGGSKQQNWSCATYMVYTGRKWWLPVNKFLLHSASPVQFNIIRLSSTWVNTVSVERPLDSKTQSSLTWVNTTSAVTTDVWRKTTETSVVLSYICVNSGVFYKH